MKMSLAEAQALLDRLRKYNGDTQLVDDIKSAIQLIRQLLEHIETLEDDFK